MMGLNEVMLSFDIPCYYLLSVLVPYALVLLQLMGVYPCFQRVFVLCCIIGKDFHDSDKDLFG
jgi:hypothetical protein